MITNEVAFVAIAVSDKERARKFYQEVLELKPSSTQMDGAWVEYDLGPTTIGVGCHPAWKPSRDGTSASKLMTSMLPSRSSKSAVSRST
jgi:catechol 2,3-dioxygenase-like lactoylglutathione lyase family enzyme